MIHNHSLSSLVLHPHLLILRWSDRVDLKPVLQHIQTDDEQSRATDHDNRNTSHRQGNDSYHLLLHSFDLAVTTIPSCHTLTDK